VTASNGGSQGRIVDHIEGIVQATNPRGVRLIGEQDYRNFSKYAQPSIAPPPRGVHVVLGLDSDGFVRELQIEPGVGTPAPALADPSRDRQDSTPGGREGRWATARRGHPEP
jgi:hypothetical protein